MNDFTQLEKTIVRELSCRLCLCTDVVKLKPLSVELKRKIKRLYGVVIRSDDTLPKAICHDCLQLVGIQHLFAVKVEKTQKFLEFRKNKLAEKAHKQNTETVTHTVQANNLNQNALDTEKKQKSKGDAPSESAQHQGDSNKVKTLKKKTPLEMKFMESMPLEEFVRTENVDESLLSSTTTANRPVEKVKSGKRDAIKDIEDSTTDVLDPIVIVDGRPAKQGAALDRQITLFYKMECCICHQNDFNYRSLMKHYKERHGVPGYVECCDKKFHYFCPKKIIEHMAYHLQPNIFMCSSCHTNFQSSQELIEHQNNGGRSEGKILCPRCQERYPTYHELGCHIISHREANKLQCDYCGKLLKHHHRKKTVNHMEDVILCSTCIRSLRNIEKQEKEIVSRTFQKGSKRQKEAHNTRQSHNSKISKIQSSPWPLW
ncbi:myoneurin-like isoform X1 [Leguminivora glycinivorella]|uniref:myoneurin-like isoform X1 n=1 Tax=Leguminivora glycinivorella TaxID=1035111 RepID=UPI00200E6910|nr:myoneurin-like isoform X1 [Leguminivora glycinivorella]